MKRNISKNSFFFYKQEFIKDKVDHLISPQSSLPIKEEVLIDQKDIEELDEMDKTILY